MLKQAKEKGVKMQIEPAIQVLSVLISSSVAALIGMYSGKRKSKAEADSLAQQTASNVLAMVNSELSRLREREEANMKKINELERRDLQNRLTIHAMEAELYITRNLLNQLYPNRHKMKVFVLDDYEFVLRVLKTQLGKISLIDVKTFDSYNEFLGALSERPEILIIDYHLDGKHTANDILDTIEATDGYQPRIIIMSGHEEDHIREKIGPRNIWRIFNKNGTYVFEISREIMEYVKNHTI